MRKKSPSLSLEISNESLAIFFFIFQESPFFTQLEPIMDSLDLPTPNIMSLSKSLAVSS